MTKEKQGDSIMTITKVCTATVGLFVIGLSLFSIASQSYYIDLLISTNFSVVAARIVLALFLLAYAFDVKFRTLYARNMLGALGLVLMVFGAVATVNPTLFGTLTNYFLLGDALIFLELGVWAKVVSSELAITPVKKPKITYTPIPLVYRSLLPEVSPSKARKFAHNVVRQA